MRVHKVQKVKLAFLKGAENAVVIDDEGVTNWKDAEAIVTVKYPGAENIIIKMDSFDTQKRMCGLALLENVNDETFSVQKIIQFFDGHEEIDRAFNWGLRWKPERK
ncbi:MAG: hypothetical protein J5923_07215 [Acidaminococcaceae bacterium]|nr:hypothetical protein [Acidaminococcaceae bacterium]